MPYGSLLLRSIFNAIIFETCRVISIAFGPFVMTNLKRQKWKSVYTMTGWHDMDCERWHNFHFRVLLFHFYILRQYFVWPALERPLYIVHCARFGRIFSFQEFGAEDCWQKLSKFTRMRWWWWSLLFSMVIVRCSRNVGQVSLCNEIVYFWKNTLRVANSRASIGRSSRCQNQSGRWEPIRFQIVDVIRRLLKPVRGNWLRIGDGKKNARIAWLCAAR